MPAIVVRLFQFTHGLAFFTLGMAIFFIAPRARRLEIGRRLPLLAIFAFCEAIVAWGVVLNPVSSTQHAPLPISLTAVLGLGYGTLLGFGLLTSPASGNRIQARSNAPWIITGLWLVGLLIIALTGAPLSPVSFWGEIIARYGLALPGGLLALWGMRGHTYRIIDPEVQKLIKGSRRITGIALGVYGLLAGLIIPSVLLALDPETASQIVVFIDLPISICSVAITYGLTRTLNVVRWEIEHWIEGVEEDQALAADRERIGRELHDGIIQSIYAAGLMLEGVRHTIQEDSNAAQEQLSRVMNSLNLTIQDIRRYIFDLRGGTPEANLVNGLQELLRDFRVNTLLETQLKVVGDETRPLGVERRRHILQVAREALSNVARHARARHVDVHLIYRPDGLQLQIADDGVGLTVIPTNTGQGLRNIRERASMLEGILDIDSAPGQGFTLTLTVPYPRREGL